MAGGEMMRKRNLIAIAALIAFSPFVGGDPAVRVERLPPVRPPCPVSELSAGDVFRATPGGELWMRCDAAKPDYAEKTHSLFGVSDQPPRGWTATYVVFGVVIQSPAVDWVYAVAIGPDRAGLLVRMVPDWWAWPVADVRIKISEP